MSTLEELREDAKAEEYERAMPEDCDVCGRREWRCIGTDPQYGADADGRRGTRLAEWECACGNVIYQLG